MSMVTLSQEMNRLLGNAMLDTELQKCLFGSQRAAAMAKFALSPFERSVLLSSSARTLSGLAHDVCEGMARMSAKAIATHMVSDYDVMAARAALYPNSKAVSLDHLQRVVANVVAARTTEVSTEVRQPVPVRQLQQELLAA